MTLREALVMSLNARRGVYAGQTWGDFQAAMLQLGMKDSDQLASIEYGIVQMGAGRLMRDDTEEGVEIREVR
mgnify:FL=1